MLVLFLCGLSPAGTDVGDWQTGLHEPGKLRSRADPELVRQALETAEAFAPVARSAGLIGPAVVVADDADDQARLLAVFGRGQS